MAPKIKKQNKKRKAKLSFDYMWVGVGIASLLFVWAAVNFWGRLQVPFQLVEADDAVIVFIRNEIDTTYTLEYTGKDTVVIRRMVPMIEGPPLYVQVVNLYVTLPGGEEVQLGPDGYLAEGSEFQLNRGDQVVVRVTYRGEEIGANRFFGFRLDYNSGDKELVGVNIEFGDGYNIYVE